MKKLKTPHLFVVVTTFALALAGLAFADPQAGEPDNVHLTCVGCGDPSSCFHYNTYLGRKALITIEQVCQAKEEARRAWEESSERPKAEALARANEALAQLREKQAADK